MSFYMLFVEGQNSPTHKHETIAAAQAEAARLAKKTGRRVWVLKPQGFVEMSEPRYFDIESMGVLSLEEQQ